MLTLKYTRAILWLCVASAILYNSWPLGYVLNNKVAHHGLISDLGAINQPFNWLFIMTDILTGIFILAVVMFMRSKTFSGLRSNAWSMVSIGLLLFGLFTAISALLPLNCYASVVGCGAHLNQAFGLHDVTGGIAAFGIFISLMGASTLAALNKLSGVLKRMTWTALIAWSASGILFVILTEVNKGVQLMQQIFLILSGFAVIIIGFIVHETVRLAQLNDE
ncbi:MAG: DUF998 domain-containing protein [Candidatus Saccharimonadales bacterium]|jgi:hypothetical membrane protein